jgi:isoprenylcysteine carboxyl methyltransferase (ICMT) family protein YpbQ
VKGQEVKTSDTCQFNGGGKRLLDLAFFFNVVVFIFANAFNYFKIGIFNDFVGWIGIVSMLCGIMLRVWANRTLVKFYTRTLLITESHTVVQKEPYEKVCHLGYLGTLST